MVRQLAFLTRVMVLAFALVTLLALAMPGPEDPAAASRAMTARWDSIQSNHLPYASKDEEKFYLIERDSGRSSVIALPGTGTWSDLSISPWTSATGAIEAVGLHASSSQANEEYGFLGLARLRLPEARIIDQVQLDLLPTSRPCWVPMDPDAIVFAAGDGRLYRVDFAPADGSGPDARAVGADGTGPIPRPFVWKCPEPSNRNYYFSDPGWPAHPMLSHMMVASLVNTPPRRGDVDRKGSWLWWLRIGADGCSIVQSGLLLDPSLDDDASRPEIRRYPTLVMNSRGEAVLAYLAHGPGQSYGTLRTARYIIDPATGVPQVIPGTHRVIASHCSSVAPVFTSDGEYVLSLGAATGQLQRYPVGGPIPESHRLELARKQ